MLRFIVSTGYSSIPDMLTMAKAADDAGVDGFAIPDHVFFPDEPKTPYPYTSDGSLPFSLETTAWPDPWVTIGALGAVTTRLSFLTHVYVLALRHPLLVAHATATAANVAPGRVMLGIGVGWQRDEFDVLGMPFETRGTRTSACIEILREIWATGHLAAQKSEHFDLPGLRMMPTPPSPIPIIVGGESEAAKDRAARIGDGFMTLPHTPDELLPIIADIRDRVVANGRDPATFLINARCPQVDDPELFAALEQAGATSVNVTLWPLGASLDAKLDAIREFAQTVVAPYRQRRSE